MFTRLTLAKKIWTLVALFMICIAGLSGYTLWSLFSVGSDLNKVADEDLALTDALSHAALSQRDQSLSLERAVRFAELVGRGDQTAQPRFQRNMQRFDNSGKQLHGQLAKSEQVAGVLEREAASTREHDRYKADLEKLKGVADQQATYEKHAARLLDSYRTENVAERNGIRTDLDATVATLESTMSTTENDVRDTTAELVNDVQANEQHTTLFIAIVSVSVFLTGIFLALVLIRSITRPVGDAVHGLSLASSQISSAAEQLSASDRKSTRLNSSH